jgi:hypothetical protein
MIRGLAFEADCAKRSDTVVIPTIADAGDFPDNQLLNSEAIHVGTGILTA